MKIRRVMARKGDTPEYVNKMQQEVFEVLAEARSWLSIAGLASRTIPGDVPRHRLCRLI